MRNSLLASLLFALATTTAALPAMAAPAAPVAEMAPVAVMGPVNLNSADQDTLQRELAGIGSAKAAAIVAHRESKGPFTSVDELLEVQGIGKSLLDKNRDRLTLK